jgi:hypothetical protein
MTKPKPKRPKRSDVTIPTAALRKAAQTQLRLVKPALPTAIPRVRGRGQRMIAGWLITRRVR